MTAPPEKAPAEPTAAPLSRKAILDRFGSIEELDRLMTVTAPSDWIALVGIAAVLLVALLWSLGGTLPIHVEGQGILIRRGGVLDVISLGEGQLTAIYVEVGDVVEKNQVVARIARPDLVKELEQKKGSLLELTATHRKLDEFGAQEVKLRAEKREQERAAARAALSAASSRVEWLQAKLAGAKDEESAQATRRELESARQEMRAAEVSLKGAALDALEEERKRATEAEESGRTLNEMQRAIAALELRLEEETRVSSPNRGRVLELRANVGDLVSAGVPLMNLDPMDEAIGELEDLEALIYVPSTEGKKIRTGMTVQLSPSVARREEHGYLLGEVTFVADFPATAKGMMRVLGNEELVRAFLARSGGTALTVRASLARDPTSPSGYRWSSRKGPDTRLTTGTPCRANIRVEERAPIGLIVPALEGLLGGS